MLNIFYQNKTLNDTLIINISEARPSQVTSKGDVTIGHTGNVIHFINIARASSKINTKQLKDGLLFLTNELSDYIKTLSGQNISGYFNNGFKVGLIKDCCDIAGTHLHKCVVDIGDKELNIICGAPNARQGLKVVVATAGTMLPSGKLIVPGELMGNKSEGMLCSYRELNMPLESKGIIELNDSYQLGSIFKEVYSNL